MTIYEIAKKAGVSASTVSRVINNKNSVNEETRITVQKILEENNFHLNETARSLSTKQSKMIGILVADIRNSHYTGMAYETETNLLQNGYCSIIINAGNTPKRMQESIKILSHRQVDGAVIIGSIFQNKTVEKSLKKYFNDRPIVFLNGSLPNHNAYNFVVAEDEGVKDLVYKIKESGYKNILFMSWMNTVSNELKIKGYIKAIEEINYKPYLLNIDAEDVKNHNTTNFINYLKENKEIDSIICSDDYLATLVIKTLTKEKIQIPEEIGIVGINNSEYCLFTTPSLTSLDNKLSELGQLGAQSLINLLNNKKVSKKIQIFPEIIERESLKR